MGIDELVNQVIIEHYDTDTGKTGVVHIHDIGLREAMGGYTVSKKIRYNGCNSRSLANKLGTRDMRALSRPLKRVKLACNREAATLRPGDVFKWSNTDEGVTDMVLRVKNVKRGGLKDRRITLECVQDVFRYGTESYDVENPEEWVDPTTIEAADLADVKLIEAPYWYYWWKFNKLPTDYEAGDGAVLTITRKPENVYEYYKIQEKLSAESAYETLPIAGDFCANGYLDSSGITYDAISGGAVTVTLQEYRLKNVRLNSAALIDDEIYRVDAVDEDTGQVTLSVGCADTVTKEHPANSIVWFWSLPAGYAADGYVDGNTVNIKLLPSTPFDRLDPASATAHSITLDERADKPYPPGKLRINTNFYPDAILGILNLSWEHRNRVTQSSELHDEADTGFTPETGTNYELRWYDEDGNLSLTTDTPSTSDSWDYEDTDSGKTWADGTPRYNNQIRIRLWTDIGGLVSFQEHDYTFNRADFGYSFGKHFFGEPLCHFEPAK
jgi:hypothetical protein